MVIFRSLALVSLLVFFSCNQKNKVETETIRQIDSLALAQAQSGRQNFQVVAAEKESNTEAAKPNVLSKDEEEIQNLIRQVLSWSNSEKAITLLPALTDGKGAVYIGFDMSMHRANLQSLRKTGIFSDEFIEDYDRIILTLNRKLKNKELDEWLVGELPTFSFANDVDPWCLCQDVPYDTPNPWASVEVEALVLKDNEGSFQWKWGKLGLNHSPDWKEFRYRFKVKKSNGQWKVSYLEGFDFEKSTK
ncbi:hypothetical protein [Rufibacter roseolus]|uniref:hypothetical protein n=1 Tax=Rufibacter roseolus TaxID=2817375 RepID=UPI001B302809|nr:hypothetical protein [Rufibacter roseolus]